MKKIQIKQIPLNAIAALALIITLVMIIIQFNQWIELNTKTEKQIQLFKQILITHNTKIQDNNNHLLKEFSAVSQQNLLLSDYQDKKEHIETRIILGLVFISIIIAGLAYRYYLYLYKPMQILNNNLETLLKDPQKRLNITKGHRFINQIQKKTEKLRQRELAIINDTEALIKDDFEASYTLYREDMIGNRFHDLYENMKRTKEEEKKNEKEREIRNWTSEGLSKFNQLLRSGTNDIKAISDMLLPELVKYLTCNQGGFFIIRDENSDHPFFEMISTYAYGRKKYKEKEIRPGEGLIGTMYYEKAYIYLTDIPEGYAEITSGLGGAKPKSLLILPLVKDDQIYGVIEIASFTELEPYQVNFAKQVANNIAETIAIVKINESKEKLLEQSQKQAEELSQQEEELKQNLEELSATQDDMEKKKIQLEEQQELLNTIIDLIPFPVFVKNKNYEYLVVNKEQAKLWSGVTNNLKGRKDSDFIKDAEEIEAIRQSDRKVLEEEEPITLPEQSISFPDGTKRILQTKKVPFINNITKNRNILGVSIDYTAQREMEEKLNEQKQSYKRLKKEFEKQNSHE